MAWVQATFELPTTDPDAISDALLAHGALSVELSDACAGTPAERPLFDEPGAAVGAWPVYRVQALFDAGADATGAVSAALRTLDVAPPARIELAAVADQDWVRQTQQQFGPIRICDRLWIVPTWSEAPDPAALNLRLDPGLAFGTGSHATTRQCLLWLEANLRPGQSVLDYGCGSGILAIAARRLGAGAVVALDIDPVAVLAARANAAANAVDVEVVSAEASVRGPFDLVLANILANPLEVLAPLLAGEVRAGGRIVLAGILAGQVAEVMAAYAPWFEMAVASELEGWACLSGVRCG
jgi:ribosomal protein L11 methyltransferase